MWGACLATTTQTRPEEPGWERLTRYLQKNHTVQFQACVPRIPTPRRKCALTLFCRIYWGKYNEQERCTAEPTGIDRCNAAYYLPAQLRLPLHDVAHSLPCQKAAATRAANNSAVEKTVRGCFPHASLKTTRAVHDTTSTKCSSKCGSRKGQRRSLWYELFRCSVCFGATLTRKGCTTISA